jgi:hypothetical protein
MPSSKFLQGSGMILDRDEAENITHFKQTLI